MDVQSLAYQTDIGICRLGGASVENCGDHLVIETSANPGFWWGNFILLATPPGPGEAEHLRTMFKRAFPFAAHVAIGVDGTDGEPGDAAVIGELGLDVETNVVLSAPGLREPRPPGAGAVLRRFGDDDDWAQAVELRLEVYEESGNDDHRAFVERHLAQSRALCERGDGAWFGAFADSRLVSSVGLLRTGPDTGRYQTVETLVAYRRHGLAGRLIYEAGRWGANALGLRRLVICADPEYHALRLYEALGFVAVERQVQLQRPPAPASSAV